MRWRYFASAIGFYFNGNGYSDLMISSSIKNLFLLHYKHDIVCRA